MRTNIGPSILRVDCDCFGEIVELSDWRDNQYGSYVDLTIYHSGLTTLWYRVKSALKYIIYGDLAISGVSLDIEKIGNIGNFCNECVAARKEIHYAD